MGEPDIRYGDLDHGWLIPLVRKKSTAGTLTAIVRRKGVQRERVVEDCAALGVHVGGLSAKTAAGISAVISMIAYVHQMGDIVLSA
jgi:hypothetical protein